MKKGKVTVGFLSYNGGQMLQKTLDSLVQQDYQNKEIIIYDDCSTDGSDLVCQEYARLYPCVRLFQNKQNVGVLKNFQNLLPHIDGEFFLWAGGDDVYAPNFLTASVKVLEQDRNNVIAISDCKIVFKDKELLSKPTIFDHVFNTKTLLMKIIKLEGEHGEWVGYENGIHNLVRSERLPSLCSEHIFFSCEKLFLMNALVGGHIRYVSNTLYIKNVPVDLVLRNKEFYAIYNRPFSNTKHLLSIVFSICRMREVGFQHRLSLLRNCRIAMQYEIFPAGWRAFRQRIREVDARFFGGKGLLLLKYIRSLKLHHDK